MLFIVCKEEVARFADTGLFQSEIKCFVPRTPVSCKVGYHFKQPQMHITVRLKWFLKLISFLNGVSTIILVGVFMLGRS